MKTILGDSVSFIESRLVGVGLNKNGKELTLFITLKGGTDVAIEMHNVDKLLINEFRQSNIIDEVNHWTHESCTDELRQAVFYLTTGRSEDECDCKMLSVATNALECINRGEMEIMEITAIFGAQILASFSSMTIRQKSD
ncbi:hypothetical protein [Paracidovorax anthurii]|uniref:hypothetical protein n=1 Tax=Paracidovorax anthurii TaxID=78229 RepID=UPI0011BDA857|nr:hypothetical protein [Paracidovorax anthurii]